MTRRPPRRPARFRTRRNRNQLYRFGSQRRVAAHAHRAKQRARV